MQTILWFLFALEVATFGPGNRFSLEQSKDDFGMRSHGIIETLGPNKTKFYPLPQSTAQDYARLRPEDLRINPFSATADHYDRQEVIGPYQIEGGKIWFGNNYYDGEGDRGVGAFGYFDTSTRSYTIFSPPSVARYEISAIEVQPDVVWLALDRFGESASTSPGGLVQWNRTTREIHKYPLKIVVSGIRVQGDSLRLQTRNGYVLFRGGPK
ncbi:MAG TPA: hypothetical protein VK686_09190 [Bryobacteraceae bacterium]|jgi:hypothetical protein|nr:hypothetical protein [Bryobacteraceae bacterium]